MISFVTNEHHAAGGRPLFDGPLIEETIPGRLNGTPFTTMSWTGFNASTNAYEATRIATTNTMRIAETGTYDEKTNRFELNATNPGSLWLAPRPPPCSRASSWALTRASLLGARECTTLSYMKKASVTIRLDAKLQREVDRLSRELGRSRSDVVRDALRRQLALVRFERLRRQLLPLAEAQGILTDEDVFNLVS